MDIVLLCVLVFISFCLFAYCVFFVSAFLYLFLACSALVANTRNQLKLYS